MISLRCMISRLFTNAPKTKVLVNYLPRAMTEPELRVLINKETAVIDIANKYTHITFESEADALEVQTLLNGYQIGKNIVRAKLVEEEHTEKEEHRPKEREEKVFHPIETFHIRRDFMPYVKPTKE